jgi:hypothetical protein
MPGNREFEKAGRDKSRADSKVPKVNVSGADPALQKYIIQHVRPISVLIATPSHPHGHGKLKLMPESLAFNVWKVHGCLDATIQCPCHAAQSLELSRLDCSKSTVQSFQLVRLLAKTFVYESSKGKAPSRISISISISISIPIPYSPACASWTSVSRNRNSNSQRALVWALALKPPSLGIVQTVSSR